MAHSDARHAAMRSIMAAVGQRVAVTDNVVQSQWANTSDPRHIMARQYAAETPEESTDPRNLPSPEVIPTSLSVSISLPGSAKTDKPGKVTTTTVTRDLQGAYGSVCYTQARICIDSPDKSAADIVDLFREYALPRMSKEDRLKLADEICVDTL